MKSMGGKFSSSMAGFVCRVACNPITRYIFSSNQKCISESGKYEK